MPDTIVNGKRVIAHVVHADDGGRRVEQHEDAAVAYLPLAPEELGRLRLPTGAALMLRVWVGPDDERHQR